MKTKLIISILLGIICLTQLISSASAASFDLSISPQIFQIELTPPAVASAKQTITLENNSDDPLPLSIQFKPFRPEGDNGEITYLKPNDWVGNDPEIYNKVIISQDNKPIDSLVLPPKAKKQLDLTVSIPRDEPPGDYYFSVLFLNKQDEASRSAQSSFSSAVGGVAMNVLLSIGPKTRTTGSIEEFSTPFFQAEGPVSFKVKIKNTSSHFIYPKAQVVITNMFGQKIGKLDLLPVNILSNSSRSLPSKEQFIFAANTNPDKNKQIEQIQRLLTTNHQPLAVWPEVFLLGPYKATLTVALSDQGPLYVKSITFIGVPVYVITGFVICILLILAIRVRLIRRHMRES